MPTAKTAAKAAKKVTAKPAPEAVDEKVGKEPSAATDLAPPKPPARKRAPAAKKAAAPETVVADTSSPAPTSAPPTPPAPVASRDELIREAAYRRFLSRGSVGGHEVQDWLDAEAEVDAQADAKGNRR